MPIYVYKLSYPKTISMTETLYWAIGILALAGLAYFVLSIGPLPSVSPAPAPSCGKCPKMNKTNVEAWQ